MPSLKELVYIYHGPFRKALLTCPWLLQIGAKCFNKTVALETLFPGFVLASNFSSRRSKKDVREIKGNFSLCITVLQINFLSLHQSESEQTPLAIASQT